MRSHMPQTDHIMLFSILYEVTHASDGPHYAVFASCMRSHMSQTDHIMLFFSLLYEVTHASDGPHYAVFHSV